MKAEYISTDPASRVEYAATGKADLILANFTVTEEFMSVVKTFESE